MNEKKTFNKNILQFCDKSYRLLNEKIELFNNRKKSRNEKLACKISERDGKKAKNGIQKKYVNFSYKRVNSDPYQRIQKLIFITFISLETFFNNVCINNMLSYYERHKVA